jgi:peptidoglycan/LPS O-acetylase OafA/YrhL
MSATEPNNNLYQTRQHYQILDGLRGIAAIAVVIFHFMEFIIPDYSKSFIAHAYLSVDFFFCLSGFVIAYAYDERIKRLGTIEFLKLRLIRLQPFVIIGSIIGLLAFVFDPFSNLFQTYGWATTLLMFLASSFLIPYPVVHERYFNLFHLNPPTWSLFWEYIANVFYGLVLYKMKTKVLFVLTLIAAMILFYEAKISGFLGVGWGGDNIHGGGVRVLYSFLIGMFIYRANLVIKNKLGFLSIGVLLTLAFLFPFNDKMNFLIDPLLAVFYLPFIVALGAGGCLTSLWKKGCIFLGEISYPLYMIHYPFMWLFLSYMEAMKPSLNTLVMLVPVITILLIAMAYLLLKYIDQPIRNFLIKRNSQKKTASLAYELSPSQQRKYSDR